MFLGTYTPKLDDKGRLTLLPAKFRDALAEVDGHQEPRSQPGHLPAGGVRAAGAPGQQGARSNPGEFHRNLAAGFDEQHPDSQRPDHLVGRPPPLRKPFKDCVVIGAVDYLEVWSAQAWQELPTNPQRTSPRPAMKHSVTSCEGATVRGLCQATLAYFPNARFCLRTGLTRCEAAHLE